MHGDSSIVTQLQDSVPWTSHKLHLQPGAQSRMHLLGEQEASMVLLITGSSETSTRLRFDRLTSNGMKKSWQQE